MKHGELIVCHMYVVLITRQSDIILFAGNHDSIEICYLDKRVALRQLKLTHLLLKIYNVEFVVQFARVAWTDGLHR